MIMTTKQVADEFGVQMWQVGRLFEEKIVPEPERFAGKRAIPRSLLPKIKRGLQKRGFLPVVAAPIPEVQTL